MTGVATPPDADLHAALEAICRRGCRHVAETIAAMGRGEVPPELAGLGAERCAAALAELTAVMAVYDAPCDAD